MSRASILREPLPLPDDGFDAVYSSHVLEHFAPDEGASLLREMVRCVVPGGVCRVVVPDFEAACREYLARLDATATDAGAHAAQRHEWAVVNLIDQFVRERSGGRVRSLIVSGDIDEEYVRREQRRRTHRLASGRRGEAPGSGDSERRRAPHAAPGRSPE